MYINKLNIFLNKLINGIGKLRGGFPLDNVVFNYYRWLAQTTNYWRDRQFFLDTKQVLLSEGWKIDNIKCPIDFHNYGMSTSFFFSLKKKNVKTESAIKFQWEMPVLLIMDFNYDFFASWLDFKFNNDALKLDYWLWIII